MAHDRNIYVDETIQTRRYKHAGWGVEVTEKKRGGGQATTEATLRKAEPEERTGRHADAFEGEVIVSGPWSRVFDLATVLLRTILAEDLASGPFTETQAQYERARAKRVLERLRVVLPGILPSDDKLGELLRPETKPLEDAGPFVVDCEKRNG